MNRRILLDAPVFAQKARLSAGFLFYLQVKDFTEEYAEFALVLL